MMRKFLKYCCDWVKCFLTLPRKWKIIERSFGEVNARQLTSNEQISILKQQNADLVLENEQMKKQLQALNDQFQKSTENLHQFAENVDKRIVEMEETICTTLRAELPQKSYEAIVTDNKKMRELRMLLSITPGIWGDASKLHISEKASCNSCLFNTNSGSITIGDYTFASSGVSILAGSHYKQLKGFYRRNFDVPFGCDITIGNGVWFGANATVLGPATIEDDAIIAAGSVVVPGTRVEKGCVYAGIPAKKIADLNDSFVDMDLYKEREYISANDVKTEFFFVVAEGGNGIVYGDNWYGKEQITVDINTLSGCWMSQKQGDCFVLPKDGEINLKIFNPVFEMIPNTLDIVFMGEKKTFKLDKAITDINLKVDENKADCLIKLVFDVATMWNPSELKISNDSRQLGVFVATSV